MRGDSGRQAMPRPTHKTWAAPGVTSVSSSAAALKGQGKGGQKLQGLLSIAKSVHMAELEKKKKELEELKARRLGGNLAAAFAPKPAAAPAQAAAAAPGSPRSVTESDGESSDDIPEELLQAALERKREAEAQGRPDQPLLPQLQEELARLSQTRSRDAGFLLAAAERPALPRARAPAQGSKRTSDASKKSSKSRKSKHKPEACAPMNLVSSDEETLRDFPVRLARAMNPAKATPCPECSGRGRDAIGLTCLACRGHGEERPNS